MMSIDEYSRRLWTARAKQSKWVVGSR